jgi:hypothetical protein
MGRQIQKKVVNNSRHEKTSKYTEENAIGTKTGDVNWKNFYINRGREKMNFEKCFCFDGENMSNSARYYTEDKSKLSDDVSFI